VQAGGSVGSNLELPVALAWVGSKSPSPQPTLPK